MLQEVHIIVRMEHRQLLFREQRGTVDLWRKQQHETKGNEGREACTQTRNATHKQQAAPVLCTDQAVGTIRMRG